MFLYVFTIVYFLAFTGMVSTVVYPSFFAILVYFALYVRILLNYVFGGGNFVDVLFKWRMAVVTCVVETWTCECPCLLYFFYILQPNRKWRVRCVFY